MPTMTVSVTADLSDPADAALADGFIAAVRDAAMNGKPVTISASAGVPATDATATVPETTTRRGRPGRRADDAEKAASSDFVVFNADGTKRAGFAHSSDAADVVIHAACELKTHAELTAFGNHNFKTIGKLAKADQDRVMVEITAHVAKVKEAERELAEIEKDETPTAAEAQGDDATTVDKASADGELLAAFGGAAEPSPPAETEPAMSYDDFVKEMIELGRLMGAQASKAWFATKGYSSPLAVKADKYAEVIASGKAHVKTLQAGA